MKHYLIITTFSPPLYIKEYVGKESTGLMAYTIKCSPVTVRLGGVFVSLRLWCTYEKTGTRPVCRN